MFYNHADTLADCETKVFRLVNVNHMVNSHSHICATAGSVVTQDGSHITVSSFRRRPWLRTPAGTYPLLRLTWWLIKQTVCLSSISPRQHPHSTGSRREAHGYTESTLSGGKHKRLFDLPPGLRLRAWTCTLWVCLDNLGNAMDFLRPRHWALVSSVPLDY